MYVRRGAGCDRFDPPSNASRSLRARTRTAVLPRSLIRTLLMEPSSPPSTVPSECSSRPTSTVSLASVPEAEARAPESVLLYRSASCKNVVGLVPVASIEKRWKCTHCPDAFKLHHNLQHHEHVAHGIQPAVTPMSPCSEPTAEAQLLLPVRNKRHCPECQDEFATIRMLNMHIRVVHSRQPCHSCPHCQGPFGLAADLNAHILKDHDTSRHAHKCSSCKAAFATSVQLHQHNDAAHRRPHITCKECAYTSVYAGSVAKHAREAHPKSADKSTGPRGSNELIQNKSEENENKLVPSLQFVGRRPTRQKMNAGRIGHIARPLRRKGEDAL